MIWSDCAFEECFRGTVWAYRRHYKLWRILKCSRMYHRIATPTTAEIRSPHHPASTTNVQAAREPVVFTFLTLSRRWIAGITFPRDSSDASNVFVINTSSFFVKSQYYAAQAQPRQKPSPAIHRLKMTDLDLKIEKNWRIFAYGWACIAYGTGIVFYDVGFSVIYLSKDHGNTARISESTNSFFLTT